VRADHIVEDHLVVGLDDDALEIARLVAQRGVPGVVVADADGRLHALLGPPDVLRLILPPAVRESRSLARVYDEQHADRIAHALPAGPSATSFPIRLTAFHLYGDERRPWSWPRRWHT
jgi:hypothetical protein